MLAFGTYFSGPLHRFASIWPHTKVTSLSFPVATGLSHVIGISGASAFRQLVLGLLSSHNHMSHLPNKKTIASDTSKAGIIYLCKNILYKCGTCEEPYDQEKGNIGHDKWHFSSSRNDSRWNLGSIQMSKLCWNWIYGCKMWKYFFIFFQIKLAA